MLLLTGGVSPAFARKIKLKLQKELGEEYSTVLALIGKVRSTLKEKEIKLNIRRWQDALDLDSLIQFVKAGKSQKVKAALFKQEMGGMNKTFRRDKWGGGKSEICGIRSYLTPV